MTTKEFNGILSNNDTVVVKFGAQWCSPCKTMEPIIESVAKKFEGKVTVIDIDVDDSPEVTTQYKIKNIPTILYFKNNELKNKTVGAMAETELTKNINKLI